MILTTLTPKQWAVKESFRENRLTICDGSVRSGKSVGADVSWVDYCLHAPDGNLLMAGKTERTLKRNIIDPMIELLGAKRCRYVGGSGELFVCGRCVYLVGANDKRAEEKIRGLTLVGAYVDEASTVPESFWTMLLTRLSVEGAKLIATTNPDSPMHWLKVNYLDRAEELGLRRFRFKLSDNPFLPSSFVAAIEREFTGLWRRRLIDGEWAVAEGSVYEVWDEDVHVIDELPDIAAIVALGVDYGDTAPTRGVLLGISAERPARLVVMDEWAPAAGLTQAALSSDLRRWLAGRSPAWIAVDPAAAGFRNQLQVDGVANTMKAFNAVTGGIRVVASLLATGRLVVSRSCRELLAEFPSYVWDAKATARGDDAPVKQNDHSMDALRYAVASTQQIWGRYVPMTVPVDLEEAA